MIGSMPSLEINMVSVVEAQTRASSSTMMAWVTLSAPAPAVGRRDAEGRKLHLDAGLEGVPGERRRAVDLGGLGGDPLLGELAEGVAELALDVGQGKVRSFHRTILAEPRRGLRSGGRGGTGCARQLSQERRTRSTTVPTVLSSRA